MGVSTCLNIVLVRKNVCVMGGSGGGDGGWGHELFIKNACFLKKANW